MKNIQQQDKSKAKPKMSLHHFIATGGKPKDFEGCQGVSDKTVTGYKGKKTNNK